MEDIFTLQDVVDEADMPLAQGAHVRRIAVAGEFGTGKSSVINALLRQKVLPCNPGFESRPLITISHAERPLILVEDSAGNSFQAGSLEDVLEREDLSACHIRLPMPGLEAVEVIEIPFHHDGGIEAKDLQMMTDADLIIWVTIGSQAWRLSEKAIIEALPKRAREKSVLAISRADKFRTAEDLDKIEARLQKEAAAFFSEIVFVQASSENLAGAADDASIWEQSGGSALNSIARDAFAA